MSIYQLVLPAMGESVSEATVTQWLKKVGDTVVADEAVVEVATDKVDSEVASEFNGVIKKILHPVNAVVAVDAALALIETDEASPQQTVVETTPKVETPVIEKATETAESYMEQAKELVAPAVQSTTEDSRFYSPLVKNIAKQENISEAVLATISGTGKDGRVTKRDILAYVQNRKAPQTPTPPAAVKTPTATPPISRSVEDAIIPMTRMEQMISEHMTRSLQTSAHVQSFIEIDVTKLWKWREKVKQDFVKQHGVKLTFTPIFFQLVAQILPEFPLLNSSLEGTNIIKKKDLNLGMATALPDGNLIVPVIKEADSFNMVGLAKKVHELASSARNNTLNPDDVHGGTYTITNVGMFGSLTGTPIINQPQVAILALGAIRKVPAVLETEHGDVIAVRHQMVVSHSYDHRIINGAMGGMFLLRLKERIENWDNTQTL
ncbi:MAG: Dihydrolipoyllysine-residue succinyltransferase component of 2-oxoglutarate dehydrogenase complex [Bacteroidota bacterium]|nr:MAG: Dihydrolipoyllysine-residue succinyltransferase component of 2-oxoglutarate dehydrogenase complex [Bacteroidota bacterium]